jgi:putative hydrolase of the HAD superfamily
VGRPPPGGRLKHRAVIFDLFGTLVDSWRGERLLEEMSAAVSVPCDHFTRLWNERRSLRDGGSLSSEGSVRDVCAALGLEVDPDAVARAVELRLEFMREHLRPSPDVAPTLRELRRSGRKIGLISVCGPEVPALWGQTTLAPLVDDAVFSCAVRLAKPDRRIYEFAADRLGVETQRSLFVDDQEAYLAGAVATGMDAVLIRLYDEGSWEPWQGPRIKSVSEVLELVR